jgi:hypothetical protein
LISYPPLAQGLTYFFVFFHPHQAKRWISKPLKRGNPAPPLTKYFVVANNTGQKRIGKLWIAGHEFQVTQNAGDCSGTIYPPSQAFGKDTGSGVVNVTAGAGCVWTASTNPGSWDWIAIDSGGSGSGNGTLNYHVLSNNTGKDRTGTLSIAGQTFTVMQQGECDYSIYPDIQSFSGDGGAGVVNVAAPGGCSWTASTESGSWDWIGIASGQSGSGSGHVDYNVLPNNSRNIRIGTLTIAGLPFTITEQPKGCTHSISHSGQTFTKEGSSGIVNVTADSGCAWAALTSSDSWDWIGINSGGSGTGSGTVNYIVLENRSGKIRTGTLMIAGEQFLITQFPDSCNNSNPSITPSSQDFDGEGGSGSVSVLACPGFSWMASTNSGSWAWIGITGGMSGTGNGTVNYVVLGNGTSNTRTGTLTIAGRTFTIRQQPKGCINSIFPESQTFSPEGNTGVVNVSAGPNCSWTASTNSGSWDWIGIGSGGNRAGPGTVNFSVLPNNTGEDRIGTLAIAGETFTVTQIYEPPICTYTISPTSQSFGRDAASGSVTVTAGAGCAWTASTNSGSWDWVGITSGWSGTGNGTVAYNALANNTGSPRTGTLTIAGQTFTITQQAQYTICSYSISPTGNTFGAGGGTGSVTVTAGAGCAWVAFTNSGSWDWIAIDSGLNGNGNGTVNYHVLANNTGSTRTGTLTIAGKPCTVTQSGACNCANIAGNWNGTAPQYTGTSLNLSQVCCNVTGTFERSSDCQGCGKSGGPVNGTVSGNIFSVTIQEPVVCCDGPQCAAAGYPVGTCGNICPLTEQGNFTINGNTMGGAVNGTSCFGSWGSSYNFTR